MWAAAVSPKKSGGRGQAKSGAHSQHGVKQLRALILELAVRGKLVPQDEGDEPAAVLLERIAAEKARLIKEKKIKRQKVLPEIEEEEKPFDLPCGWEWARLGDITNYGVLNKIEVKEVTNNTWVLELEDIEKTTSKLLKKIRFKDRNFRSTKNTFTQGDVIYGKLRPYLDKVIIADESGVCSTEMIPLKSYLIIRSSFLKILLKSPYFIHYANSSTHGMNLPRLGTEKARLALIPILSEKEQHRIVKKVDELMALCDQLEQQQSTHHETHKTLIDTLLATLTAPSDHKQFQQDWQRIAAHFDHLFITEYSVEQLKQTILQLAVMGKLVRQDPNDEPASVLLEKIAEEKARLIKEEGLKTKAKNNIDTSEKYIKIPKNWVFCRLGNLAKFIDYRGKTPKKISNGISLITAKNVKYGFISREPYEYISFEDYEARMTRGFPEINDILFTTEAPLGNVALVNIQEKFSLAQRVICFQFHIKHIAPYIKILIMSSCFREELYQQATGMTAKGIKSAKLKEIPIPIPPLAEQHRIVTKVDELMTLCEQLKSKINHAQTTQIQLADTLLENGLNHVQ